MKWEQASFSAPINKMAALGCRPGRSDFDPESKVNSCDVRHHAPLPIKPVPAIARDLTGLVCGRLTVIGFYDAEKHVSRKQKRGRWVVRCVCGYFETRRGAALQDPEYQSRARCSACERTAEIIAGRGSAPLPILHRHDRPKVEAIPSMRRMAAPPLLRLYDAVVRGNPDLTFSELAEKADVPRENVREFLTALLRCGALRERPDGWYSRGILTSRRARGA